MKRLRVYIPFAINELKANFAYRGAHFLFVVISTFGVFISYFLWTAIYASSPNPVMGGLTHSEMIVYLFMSYVTMSISSISISEWVSEDVVKGSVAMQLIKPIDYRLSLVARGFGLMMYKFITPAALIWIGLELYKFFVLGLAFTGISQILLYLLSCIMSFLIYVLFDFCVGMVAFYTSYVFGLYMVKEALLSFLTGQLIPLSFFPGIIRSILEFMPFSSMLYTPVMIYLGKYPADQLAFVLLRQLFWVVVLYFFGSFIWNRVVKRLTVLGG